MALTQTYQLLDSVRLDWYHGNNTIHDREAADGTDWRGDDSCGLKLVKMIFSDFNFHIVGSVPLQFFNQNREALQ